MITLTKGMKVKTNTEFARSNNCLKLLGRVEDIKGDKILVEFSGLFPASWISVNELVYVPTFKEIGNTNLFVVVI